MRDMLDLALRTILIGAGATLLTDLWTLARRRLWSVALPDYALVGRWIANMAHGRFRHAAIAAAPAQRGERAIGWITHYVIGIGLACLLPAIWGADWVRHPTLVAALLVGVGSVAAPFLLMQPAMGAGIAASRTPQPNAARRRSLVMHAVFGFGLYASGWLSSLLP